MNETNNLILDLTFYETLTYNLTPLSYFVVLGLSLEALNSLSIGDYKRGFILAGAVIIMLILMAQGNYLLPIGLFLVVAGVFLFMEI
ncbi:MAG: hypothetical protein FWG91_10230 [Lachnospiraceae bacterium]|nr:hypothetical protein [Lachnospiraceae bacterium]